MTRPRRVLWVGLAVVLAGCASGVGGDAGEAQATYLASLAMFNECVAADEVPEASVEEFHVGGVEAVTTPADLAPVESCLESSGYGTFVSATGEVTLDADYIRVANEYTKAVNVCLERKGWAQDELVFDEEGWLVPSGSGPTLTAGESREYTADSVACADEVGSPGSGRYGEPRLGGDP